MLTIQILKLMDLIWKSEGLDFKLEILSFSVSRPQIKACLYFKNASI